MDAIAQWYRDKHYMVDMIYDRLEKEPYLTYYVISDLLNYVRAMKAETRLMEMLENGSYFGSIQ